MAASNQSYPESVDHVEEFTRDEDSKECIRIYYKTGLIIEQSAKDPIINIHGEEETSEILLSDADVIMSAIADLYELVQNRKE